MEEKNIIMTTLDLKQDYEIIDVIATKADKEMVKGVTGTLLDKEKALVNYAKEDLKEQCRKLGGNAIIGCQINYYNRGVKDRLSASGTVVKFKSNNNS